MKAMIRDDRDGPNRRQLEVYEDERGLHLDGWDLGPATAPVSDDGEYEWWETIAREHFPRVREVLDLPAQGSLVSLIARDWSGERSYELCRRLYAAGIPMERFCYGG